MIFSLRNYPRYGLVWLSILGLVTILHSTPAQAYPVLVEREVYHHGGALQFVLPSDWPNKSSNPMTAIWPER